MTSRNNFSRQSTAHVRGAQNKEIDVEERRENAARPHPFLGYNHDTLGLYFLDRGAEHTAEREFRRAIWLNPFEPEFKLHLAGCLFKQHRNEEAKNWLQQALEKLSERRDAKYLLELIESRLLNGDDQASPPVAGEQSCKAEGLT